MVFHKLQPAYYLTLLEGYKKLDEDNYDGNFGALIGILENAIKTQDGISAYDSNFLLGLIHFLNNNPTSNWDKKKEEMMSTIKSNDYAESDKMNLIVFYLEWDR
ncbi:MAG: hypothetical protein J5I94_21010 [Phaeodactylibacter sp.]|nr:hypothetical protein [Phaeodactylibacter sp.]